MCLLLDQAPLGEPLSDAACLFLLSLGSHGAPVGSTPWKLSDNSGHFGFQFKMQSLIGKSEDLMDSAARHVFRC